MKRCYMIAKFSTGASALVCSNPKRRLEVYSLYVLLPRVSSEVGLTDGLIFFLFSLSPSLFSPFPSLSFSVYRGSIANPLLAHC